jgi:hypothetical protein
MFRKEENNSDIIKTDQIFDMIEILTQNKLRKNFTDDEFKEILKLARKRHNGLLGAFETYKIFYDEQEFVNLIKEILPKTREKHGVSQMPEIIEMSFEYSGK